MRSRSIRSSFALSSPLRTMTEVTTAYRSVRQWNIPPRTPPRSASWDALHVRLNGFLSYLWQPLRDLTTNLATDLTTNPAVNLAADLTADLAANLATQLTMKHAI